MDALLIAESSFSWLLSSMGDVLRGILVAVGAFGLLFYFTFRNQVQSLPKINNFSAIALVIQLVCYIAFYQLTTIVFNPDSASSSLIQLLWLVILIATGISWCIFTFEVRSLFSFIKQNSKLVAISIIFAALVLLLTKYTYSLWEVLSTITLYGSSAILSLFFDSVYINAPEYHLGLENFVVHISSVCSGLEGLIIAIVTTSIYLYFLRRQLRFPIVLLLLPIAAAISILFNIIRITALLIIGAYFSPEIAIGGFHSVAGWIAAIFVAFLIIFVFSNLTIFNKENVEQTSDPISNEEDPNPDLAWAILLPFILFLFVTLVSKIFLEKEDGSFVFNYLYPIKAIVGAVVLTYFWKIYEFSMPKQWREPILGGLAIAILWVLLVPADPEYNQNFSEGLSSMSTILMVLWFACRYLGAWIVIPFIEEMVFRGYLLARLSRQPLSNDNNLIFSWIALIVSSVLFALMHHSIIAGIVAGLIFALIRYRSKSLSEPILAHAVANIAVSAWALSTGQWVVM